MFSAFPNSVNHHLATAQSSTTHRVLDGASSSFETEGQGSLLQNTSAFQEIHPRARSSSSHPTPVPPHHHHHPTTTIYHQRPPPIGAETGVLSPSHSTSTANLPGRWRLECDKSICPGLNLYANLK